MKYIVTDNTTGINVYVGEDEKAATKEYVRGCDVGHAMQKVGIFQEKEEKEEK